MRESFKTFIAVAFSAIGITISVRSFFGVVDANVAGVLPETSKIWIGFAGLLLFVIGLISLFRIGSKEDEEK